MYGFVVMGLSALLCNAAGLCAPARLNILVTLPPDKGISFLEDFWVYIARLYRAYTFGAASSGSSRSSLTDMPNPSAILSNVE